MTASPFFELEPQDPLSTSPFFEIGAEPEPSADAPDAPDRVIKPPRGKIDEIRQHNPDFAQTAQDFLAFARRGGVSDAYIKSGYRSAERQNWLHTHGYPTKGNDGYQKISPHQEARAIDWSTKDPANREKLHGLIASYAQKHKLFVPADEPWHMAGHKANSSQPDSPEQEPAQSPFFELEPDSDSPGEVQTSEPAHLSAISDNTIQDNTPAGASQAASPDERTDEFAPPDAAYLAYRARQAPDIISEVSDAAARLNAAGRADSAKHERQARNNIPAKSGSPTLTASDLQWHFGINDPNDFLRLPRSKQKRILALTAQAVAHDEQKKNEGVELEPSLDYQNSMRKQVGLGANPALIDPRVPLPKAKSFALDPKVEQLLNVRPDETFAPGYSPDAKQISVIPDGQHRIGQPNIHSISQEAMQSQLDQQFADEEVLAGQHDMARAPFVMRVIGQQWPRFVSGVQQQVANILENPQFMVPAADALRKKIAAATGTPPQPEQIKHIADYLRQRAEINSAIGDYKPTNETGLPKAITRQLLNQGYDIGVLVLKTELSGLPLSTVMAGDAAATYANESPVTQAKEIAKAYAFGRALEVLPVLVQKGFGKIPGKVGEIVSKHPEAAARTIGGAAFGALSGAGTAAANGDTEDIIASTAAGALTGGALAGGGLKRIVGEGAERVIASEKAPEWLREAAGKASSKRPAVVVNEAGDRAASVYVDPATNDQIIREVTPTEATTLIQRGHGRPVKTVANDQFDVVLKPKAKAQPEPQTPELTPKQIGDGKAETASEPTSVRPAEAFAAKQKAAEVELERRETEGPAAPLAAGSSQTEAGDADAHEPHNVDDQSSVVQPQQEAIEKPRQSEDYTKKYSMPYAQGAEGASILDLEAVPAGPRSYSMSVREILGGIGAPPRALLESLVSQDLNKWEHLSSHESRMSRAVDAAAQDAGTASKGLATLGGLRTKFGGWEPVLTAIKEFLAEKAPRPRLATESVTDKSAALSPVADMAPTDALAHEAATSPNNELPEPTQPQKEAGNYNKGHINVAGLDISIENPESSKREGVDPNGKPWSITMKSHYGYLKRTEGADGEHIDTYVRPGLEKDYQGPVFVVNQTKGNGHFDEHKVMIGWTTKAAARRAYLENYEKGWNRTGTITAFDNPTDFKKWVAEGDGTKPAEQNNAKDADKAELPPASNELKHLQGVLRSLEKDIDAARKPLPADINKMSEGMRQQLIQQNEFGLTEATEKAETVRQRIKELETAQVNKPIAGSSAPRPEQPSVHKFSSTQVNLPDDIANEARSEASRISTKDLAGDGREAKPHATVKFGLHTNDVADVRALVESEPPIRAKIGSISTFPPSESSDGAAVLKLDLDSADLHRLNNKLSALPHTDTFEYKPHVTLAYVKPEVAAKYVGRKNRLQGREITIHSIAFSSKDGEMIEIPLKGSPEAFKARSRLKGLQARYEPEVADLDKRVTAGRVAPQEYPSRIRRIVDGVNNERQAELVKVPTEHRHDLEKEFPALEAATSEAPTPDVNAKHVKEVRQPAIRTGRAKLNTQTHSLSQAVHAAGGIRVDRDGMNRGEMDRLTTKEGGRIGLVSNKSRFDAESMAMHMAEHGYRGDWVEVTNGGLGLSIDGNKFLDAVEDDMRGVKKSWSEERDVDWDQKYHEEHGKDEETQALDKLLADKRGGELADKVVLGQANEAELQELRAAATRYGVPTESIDSIVESGAQYASSQADDLQSTVSGETEAGTADAPEPHESDGQLTPEQLDEGYTLASDGTLIDPGGTPLFKREQQLGFIEDGLVQQDVRTPARRQTIRESEEIPDSRLSRLQRNKDREVSRVADVIGAIHASYPRNTAVQRGFEGLLTALDKYAYVRSVKLSVDEYLNQGALFDSGNQLTSTQEGMLRTFERLAKQETALKRSIRDYARELLAGGKEFKGEPGEEVVEAALFQKAWHGSPHAFEKFNSDHIGTGEGAQAYGWGLYFAGKKEVAEHYKNALSGRASYQSLEEKARDTYDEGSGVGEAADDFLAREDFTPQERTLVDLLQKEDWLGFDYPHQSIHAALTENLDNFDATAELRAAVIDLKQSMGHTYQVELVPAEDQYLLWDKPLVEQSEKIRASLQGEVWHPKDLGREIYQSSPIGYDPEARSKELHALGIRGIKYLNGASRGKGEGDYNYVIFDDSDVSIEAMYKRDGSDISNASTARLLQEVHGEQSGHRIKLNPAAYELLRRIYTKIQAHGGTPERQSAFTGAFNDRKLTRDVIAELKQFIDDYRSIAGPLIRLTKAFKAAAADTGTVVVYTKEGALIHEGFHRASELGAEDTALNARHAYFEELATHPVFQKAAAALKRIGYPSSRPLLVEETAAYIWEGDYESLGLTEDEAADYLSSWFGSYIAANGDQTIEAFEDERREAEQFIEEARRGNQRRQDVSGVQGRRQGGSQTPLARDEGAERQGALFKRDDEEVAIRSRPLSPEAAEPISSMGRATRLQEHPDYHSAKAGDAAAAVRVVDDILTPQDIERARQALPKDAVFVPLHAQEAAGLNRLPMALAERYASELEGEVDTDIVQANRTFHTGAKAMERLVSRPEFYGAVEPSKAYVLVDDVVTLGGTVAEAANYIQSQGGKVVGTIVLANASRTGTLKPSKKLIRLLEERYGQDIREQFGVEPIALTAAEASYLIGFKSVDALRNRAATARQEIGARRSESSSNSTEVDSNGPLLKRDSAEEVDPRQRIFRALHQAKNSEIEQAGPRGTVGGYYPKASHQAPKAQPVAPQPATPPPPPNQPPPSSYTDEELLKEVDHILADPQAKSYLDRIQNYARRLPREFQRIVTSEFTPLRSGERQLIGKQRLDLAAKAELLPGASGQAELDLLRFQTRVVAPIAKLAREFNRYLLLNRIADRLTHDAERKKVATWTVEKAQQALEALHRTTGDVNWKRIEKAAAAFQEETDATLQLRVDAGLISQEVYDAIKASSDFYAPFKVMKYVVEGVPSEGGGRRIPHTQDLIDRIKGIEDEDFQLQDFLLTAAQQIYQTRILAEKNRFMRDDVAPLANSDPEGEIIRQARPTRYYQIEYKPAEEILSQLSYQRQPIEQSLIKVGRALELAEDAGLKVRQKNLTDALGRATLGGMESGGSVHLKAFTSEVIAHELGHTADVVQKDSHGQRIYKSRNVFGTRRDVLQRISSDINTSRKFQKEMKTLVDFTGLGGDEAYRASAKERFAEFVELYIHNPKKARELAPTWTDYFERNHLSTPVVKKLVEGLANFFQKVDALPNILTPLKDLDDHNYLELAIRRAFPDRKPQLGVQFGDKARPGYKMIEYLDAGTVKALEARNDIAKALEGLHRGEASVISKAAMLAAQPFKLGATTFNLAFQPVNLLFADLPRAALISKYGVRRVEDLVRFPADWLYSAFTAAAGNFGYHNNLYTDFMKSGAYNSTIQRSLTPEAFKPELGVKRPALPKRVLNSVAKIGSAIEETSKLLGIKRGMRFEKLDTLSEEDQASRMREIASEVRRYSGSPDFWRKGIISTGQTLENMNLLFMFVNARIQGTAADLARLSGRTGGGRPGTAAWLRLSLAVGIPALTLMLHNLDDDDREIPGPEGPWKTNNRESYNAVPDWEKKNYFMIPRNQYFMNDRGDRVRDYWRIPKREIVQLMSNTIEAGILFAHDREPGQLKQFAGEFLENLSPVGISGTTAMERAESFVGSMNPIMKTPAEVIFNRDTFRHRNIVPDYIDHVKSKDLPPGEQYTRSTSGAFVKVGKALGVSPLLVEHATRGVTAGLVTQFMPPKPQPGRSPVLSYPAIGPVARRFVRSEATAKESDNEILDEAIKDKAVEKVTRNHEADQLYQSWKKNPDGKDLKAFLDKHGASPEIGKQAFSLKEDDDKNLTNDERQIKQLAVEDGSRVNFLKTMLDGKNETERQTLVREWRLKGIASPDVLRQLRLSDQVLKNQIQRKAQRSYMLKARKVSTSPTSSGIRPRTATAP
jgi:orotate phosphoribosyltransferase-like protein/2'-5' RNA ligase